MKWKKKQIQIRLRSEIKTRLESGYNDGWKAVDKKNVFEK